MEAHKCQNLMNAPRIGNPLTDILTNSDDQGGMQHNAAFHPVLHCLLEVKQPSWVEIHDHYDISTCNHITYKMGNPILIVSICMFFAFSLTVKAAPHECVIRTGQPLT